jgi:hypothetical protein
MIKKFFESLLKSPIFILCAAIVCIAFLFSMPESVDYLLEGAVLIIGRTFLGVALLLLGVFVSRFARAAFPFGGQNVDKKYIACASYLGVAFIVGCSIIASKL